LRLPAIDRRYSLRVIVTLALSAAGGFAADRLGMPAGWIAGSLLVVAIASLSGFNSAFPRRLQAPTFLLTGLYTGSGVSQETLNQMQTWPGSFAILAVSVVALILASTSWLMRRGWDRNAALLSSLPGALSVVMAVGEDLKTDMKKVAIAQSLRVLILVEAIPLVALVIGHPTAGASPNAALPVAGALDLLLLLAAGVASALLLQALRVPGAWIVGGLLASATLLLTGVVEAQLPGFVIIICAVALGAITGSRFRPGDFAVLPRIAGPALSAFAIACAISIAGAGLVTLIFGVSLIQTLIAFAPGALDALTILSFQMNIDPAYVAAHHVARFVALAAAVPLLARWMERH
jgi:membrane AbrB-like protein